jgi:hypothetical protein
LVGSDYTHISTETAKALDRGKGRTIPSSMTFNDYRSNRPKTGSETEESDDDNNPLPLPRGAKKPIVRDESDTEDSGNERDTPPPDSSSDDEVDPDVRSLADFAKTRPASLAAPMSQMQFSQDSSLLFQHLYFFLDTKENAEKLGIEPRELALPDSSPEWQSVQQEIQMAGGNVVDSLKEPKLTHVIILVQDTSRATPLFKL